MLLFKSYMRYLSYHHFLYGTEYRLSQDDYYFLICEFFAQIGNNFFLYELTKYFAN